MSFLISLTKHIASIMAVDIMKLWVGKASQNSGLRLEAFLVSNGSQRIKRSRSVPPAKRVSRSFKMEDVGSLLLVLELYDDFDGDINDIV